MGKTNKMIFCVFSCLIKMLCIGYQHLYIKSCLIQKQLFVVISQGLHINILFIRVLENKICIFIIFSYSTKSKMTTINHSEWWNTFLHNIKMNRWEFFYNVNTTIINFSGLSSSLTFGSLRFIFNPA